jgi:translation initiation factor IF-2
MINKYRVHEVAKDFNIKSTEIIELLQKYFDDTKKHMTALEENELDIIFDTFTKQHEVESFDAYFETAAEAPRDTQQPKQEEQPEAEPAKTKAKVETKPADKTENKSDKQSPKQEKEPQPSEKRPVPPMQTKKKPDSHRPMQSRTKGELHTVDTRAGHVELEKYNEKYVNIASINKPYF